MSFFNLRLLGNNLFKSFILLIFVFSYPIFDVNKELFFLFIGLLVFLFAITLNFLFEKSYRKTLNSIFIFPLLRVILLLVGTILLLYGFSNEVNESKVLAIIFIWTIPLICLSGIIELAYEMFNFQKGLEKEEGKIIKVTRVVLILLIIFATMLLPELAFGYGYMIFFKIIYGDTTLSQIDGYYLSFSISHTLPITESKLSGYISKINNDNYLRLYQSVQVYFNKFMELIIIAVLVKALFEAIGGNGKLRKDRGNLSD